MDAVPIPVLATAVCNHAPVPIPGLNVVVPSGYGVIVPELDNTRSTLDKGSPTATAYPSKSDIPFPVAVFPVNVCPREAGSK